MLVLQSNHISQLGRNTKKCLCPRQTNGLN
nr:MAG TPA: hypothetical protein [Caudoviricetes sp.]